MSLIGRLKDVISSNTNIISAYQPEVPEVKDAVNEPTVELARLDKSRDYASLFGAEVAKYEQDGKLFNANGVEIIGL